MQRDLGLVQLLLDLHDAVRLLRILVLDDVLVERREADGAGGRVRPRGPRVRRQELVQQLAEQLVRDQRRVLVVGNDDACEAFGAAVGVEGVGWGC